MTQYEVVSLADAGRPFPATIGEQGQMASEMQYILYLRHGRVAIYSSVPYHRGNRDSTEAALDQVF